MHQSSGRDNNDSYGSNERSGSSGYGSATTGGTGSGNKYTAGVQESPGLGSDYGIGHSAETTDRNEPYSGHREHGSGVTGGAGFGNKSSSHSAGDTTYGGNPDVARNSDPYTGHRDYGSGATGGAGFGNKTSNYNNDDKNAGLDISSRDDEVDVDLYFVEKIQSLTLRGTTLPSSNQAEVSHASPWPGSSVFIRVGVVKSLIMESNQRTSGALLERANANVAALIRRFENIIEYKPSDRNAAAVDAYKMEVETAALIRAAEDTLSLTRVMKEMWLFGKLQTIGTDEAEEKAEESARGVEAGLRRLMGADKSRT
ncbi:MAG: hypothetical protein Q9182_001167 [Xanthomendoza sp. 2 TL-2023]